MTTRSNKTEKLSRTLSPLSREEAIARLTSTPAGAREWTEMSYDAREKFIRIETGKDILKLTYDKPFRSVMDPSRHRKRLESLLSCILGQKVKVLRALPPEGNDQHDHSIRVYLDILVELENHELANIEIQKEGTLFPATRASLYNSQQIVYQYSREDDYNTSTATDDPAEAKHAEGNKKNLLYERIHKVYTIVIFEKSPAVFKECEPVYIHRGKITFDTQLPLEMLHEYVFINLDILTALKRPPQNELEAWLLYLNANTVAEINTIIDLFPDFQKVKDDVILYSSGNQLEVVQMIVHELDRQEQEVKEWERKQKDRELEEKDRELEEKDLALKKIGQALEEKDQALEEKGQALEEKGQALEEKDQALEEKDQALEEKDQALEEKGQALAEKGQALAHREDVLAQKERDLIELEKKLARLQKQLES